MVFHLDFQKFAQIVEFAGNRLLLEKILQVMNAPLAGAGRPLWLWTRGDLVLKSARQMRDEEEHRSVAKQSLDALLVLDPLGQENFVRQLLAYTDKGAH